jgi:hypothetical protein
MRNVAPTRSLARWARQLLQLSFLVVAAGAFMTALGLALYIIPLMQENALYNFVRGFLFIVGIIIVLAGIGIAVRAIIRSQHTDNDLAIVTGDFLQQYLDDRYTFIRNISKRGLGYVDAILVGPAGALVFRILDNSGVYANEAAGWLVQEKGQWKPARIKPTKEAVDDIQHLRDYLAQNNLAQVPVFGIIVFTKDPNQVQIMVKEPVVPVTHLNALYENLTKNYLAVERIDTQLAEAAVRVLYDAG